MNGDVLKQEPELNKEYKKKNRKCDGTYFEWLDLVWKLELETWSMRTGLVNKKKKTAEVA